MRDILLYSESICYIRKFIYIFYEKRYIFIYIYLIRPRGAFANLPLISVTMGRECSEKSRDRQLTQTIFMATSLKPLPSKRWIILPTRPRCTPSGLTMMKVRCLFSAIIELQITCSKIETEHRTMRCRRTAKEWEQGDGKPQRVSPKVGSDVVAVTSRRVDDRRFHRFLQTSRWRSDQGCKDERARYQTTRSPISRTNRAISPLYLRSVDRQISLLSCPFSLPKSTSIDVLIKIIRILTRRCVVEHYRRRSRDACFARVSTSIGGSVVSRPSRLLASYRPRVSENHRTRPREFPIHAIACRTKFLRYFSVPDLHVASIQLPSVKFNLRARDWHVRLVSRKARSSRVPHTRSYGGEATFEKCALQSSRATSAQILHGFNLARSTTNRMFLVRTARLSLTPLSLSPSHSVLRFSICLARRSRAIAQPAEEGRAWLSSFRRFRKGFVMARARKSRHGCA